MAAYESKIPDIVYGLFFYESDGYTYACEVLKGIFWSKEDAEVALEEITGKEKRDNAGGSMRNPTTSRSNYEIQDIEIGTIL